MISENNNANTMKSRTIWGLLVFLVIGLPIAFPVYQLLKTNGYLFYSNAYDEPSYLSYEGSLFIQSILRPSQYLVTLFHEIGFSGGSINFTFDLICVGITLVFLRKIFIELGFKGSDASIGTFLVFSLPVFFGMANPWYSTIFNANLSSGAIFWIALPEAFFPAFYRTPEPQFSWMLVSVASYVALKKKTYLPLYLVIPFLLEFIKVPLLFIVLSLHFSKLNEKRKLFNFKCVQILIGSIVFVLISLLISIYYKLWIEGSSQDAYLTQTHLPLASGTSIITLLIVFSGKRFLDNSNRRFAFFAATASLAALNTQIFSGFIVSPTNFEQYFGVIALVFLTALMVLSIKSFSGLKYVLAAAGMGLMILYTKTVFQIHSHPVYTDELPEELVLNLKDNSSRVVLENVHLASALGMVLPRQRLTALSYTQSFPFAAGKYFDNYLCVKEKIKAEKEEISDRYQNALKTLDRAYKYQNADFVLLHNKRKTRFDVFFDLSKKPQKCDQAPLLFFLENKK
jgi:hypothetical protein